MLLKNVKVIDPASEKDFEGDVLIKNGYIEKVLEGNLDCDSNEEVFDLSGKILAPSFFDTHVHFRDFEESDKETYETGAHAALRGGYTHVCAMANSKPPIDSVSKYEEVQEKIKNIPIDIYQAVNMTIGMKGENLTDFESLKKIGVECITDDGFPIVREDIMIEALKLSQEYGFILSLHEEDPSFIEHPGYDDTANRKAEISIIERDLKLLEKYGGHINIQHLSSKESVELIRDAKKSGLKFTCEVTPTHLFFTKDMVEKYGTLLKVNPPVRTEEDRVALIEGLKDGTIDMIATDHAPHTAGDKKLGEFKSKSGLISIETAFSVAMEKIYHKNIMSMREIIRCLSTNPRALFGINSPMAPGERADLVVLDKDAEYIYDHSYSKSKNTPLFGRKMIGKVLMTIKDGKVLYNDLKEGTSEDRFNC